MNMKVNKKRTSSQEGDIARYRTKWVPKKQKQASENDPQTTNELSKAQKYIN